MTDTLFIALYFDEDLSSVLARMLRGRGFSVVTVAEVGRRGLRDEDQLAYAAQQGRAIVTHNRLDFERLAGRWMEQGRTHAGIILAVRRPVHELAARLAHLLDDVPAYEMVNQVRYV